MEVFRTAVALMVRSMVLSAQSAGQQRLSLLQRAVAAKEEVGELARLRDENRRLADVDMVKTPFRAPDANAHAERCVRSVTGECLDHLILFGMSSLQRALRISWCPETHPCPKVPSRRSHRGRHPHMG